MLGGAQLGAGFRFFGVEEAIYGRVLTGQSNAGGTRWLEVGLSASYRLWLARSFRLVLGGSGGFASAHLASATAVEGALGAEDTWSARAGGLVGGELRVAPAVWLSLTLEPGAVLRPIHFDKAGGIHDTLGGAWLGASLGVVFEVVKTAPMAGAAGATE